MTSPTSDAKGQQALESRRKGGRREARRAARPAGQRVHLTDEQARDPLGDGQADADGEVGQAAGPLTLFHSDFGALAWCFLGFLAFAVLLPWLGWILAGALLFWCVTRAFGAPHPVFDILVALFVSSLAYLGFAVALGLTLPSGILGGGF